MGGVKQKGYKYTTYIYDHALYIVRCSGPYTLILKNVVTTFFTKIVLPKLTIWKFLVYKNFGCYGISLFQTLHLKFMVKFNSKSINFDFFDKIETNCGREFNTVYTFCTQILVNH